MIALPLTISVYAGVITVSGLVHMCSLQLSAPNESVLVLRGADDIPPLRKRPGRERRSGRAFRLF